MHRKIVGVASGRRQDPGRRPVPVIAVAPTQTPGRTDRCFVVPGPRKSRCGYKGLEFAVVREVVHTPTRLGLPVERGRPGIEETALDFGFEMWWCSNPKWMIQRRCTWTGELTRTAAGRCSTG